MSKKITIQGSALYVLDTVSGITELVKPSKDTFYDDEELKQGFIIFTNLNRISGYGNKYTKILLSESINRLDVAFTETTFRQFCISNLGFEMNEEYYVRVGEGKVPGRSLVHKFGAIQNVGATLTPITTSGKYPTPKILTALEIVSDSANDAVGGTGLISLTLYVNSNVNGIWKEQIIPITLDGLTPVPLPNDVFRVYRIEGDTSGIYGSQDNSSHDSTITLRETVGGAIWHIINSESGFGLGQSEIAVYTVEKGVRAQLLSKKITIESSKSADVLLFIRENADIVVAPYSVMKLKEIERNLEGTSSINPDSPIIDFTGPADIGFMAKAPVGSANISVDFELLLIEDGY